MNYLELLAPARNIDIGIAAIDSGADAVYIGGPDFGARKAAGNSLEDIARLCEYAHQFGVRVFVTVNNIVYEGERQEVHKMMLGAQEAGADAFIARDPFLTTWNDIKIPLHASTQCAIRSADRARQYENLGFTRLVLERQLSLTQVREIRDAVDCELEFFVHGALCVGYSGECYLSEHINGRSANRGDCMQACRSLYDLTDSSGKVLKSGKALLSLKDYNLMERLPDLIAAGIISFKIEGRLKNESYVKNVVRAYSVALDKFVNDHPEAYRRASFGTVEGGFSPDVNKTFNRGYTELFLDEKKGKWSSMDAPKSVGEYLGKITRLSSIDRYTSTFELSPVKKNITLKNGDGFCLVTGNTITGFRGDVCNGLSVRCKSVSGLNNGADLYRNINAAFEKELEVGGCRRMISSSVKITVTDGYSICCEAKSEDGRTAGIVLDCGSQKAENKDRMLSLIEGQLAKRSRHYIISKVDIDIATSDNSLPFLSAASINQLRRDLTDKLDGLRCNGIPLQQTDKTASSITPAYDLSSYEKKPDSLMRSKYCIKYELGLCPVHQGARNTGKLFLQNNGRRFALGFDCSRCEMTVEREA